jgi:hypothetical protein
MLVFEHSENGMKWYCLRAVIEDVWNAYSRLRKARDRTLGAWHWMDRKVLNSPLTK